MISLRRRQNRISISKFIFISIACIFSLCCVLPFLLVLSGSFTQESQLLAGLSLIPRQFSTLSYEYMFRNPDKIITGYRVTITVTLVGTFVSVMINALMAYPLSKKNLKYKNIIAFYAYFTMLFNGGMVPWYLVCVNVLGLYDNIAALILPYVANAWYMLLLRNYFKTIPDEMQESAIIDGAGELKIFFRIILPLSVPVLATVTLFVALLYWNDWWLGIMLVDNDKLLPLQLLLRVIVSNAQYITSGSIGNMLASQSKPPAEGTKYAATIITIGPILFLYPFLQKYFIKGLMIGAIKG